MLPHRRRGLFVLFPSPTTRRLNGRSSAGTTSKAISLLIVLLLVVDLPVAACGQFLPPSTSTTSTDGYPPLESSVSLDEWQQQFLQFITYPSDHVHTRTGTKVSLRDTIVWGRQKVLWTTPFLQMKQQQDLMALGVA